MIGKVDGRTFLEPGAGLRSPAAPSAGGGDFHALLQQRLAEPRPLERMAVEFLRHALDLVLSGGKSEGYDPFLSPFLLPPVPVANPQKSSPASTVSTPETGFEMSESLPINRDFDQEIETAGLKYNVDPALIKAVIQVESGGNPAAVSRAGARGLMQLMPATAAEMGVADPFDPAQNIMGGTRYLRRLLDRYRGDTKLALAAYNWGMGNVENRLEAMPKETRNFIAKVEGRYSKS